MSSSYAPGVICKHHTLGWFAVQLQGIYARRSREKNETQAAIKKKMSEHGNEMHFYTRHALIFCPT
jgi:hypothetical protein